jgi:hypothetical protein
MSALVLQQMMLMAQAAATQYRDIGFVGMATWVNVSGSLRFTPPAGTVAGDVVLITNSCFYASGNSFTAPAGTLEVIGFADSNQLYVGLYTLTEADMQTGYITVIPQSSTFTSCAVYHNVDASPLDTRRFATGANTLPSPVTATVGSIDTSLPKEMRVAILFPSPSGSDASVSDPPGWSVGNAYAYSTGGASHALYYSSQADAGATGDVSEVITVTGSPAQSGYMALLMALRPKVAQPAITLSATFPSNPHVGDTVNFDVIATLVDGATGTPTIMVDQLPAGLTLGTTSQADATHYKATVSGTYTTAQAGTSTYSVTGGSVAAAPLVHGYNVQAAATSGYWNPVQTSSAITISGATATRGAAADAWRSTVGAATASGLRYFEVAIGTLVNKDTIGVANASANVTNYIGADNNSIGLHSNGTVFRSGGNVGSGGTYASGDVVMIAVDEPNRKIWFGKNGTWVSGNPVTETSAILIAATGELYPAAALYSNGSSVTLRLSNSEFSYAPPSGYSSWSGT